MPVNTNSVAARHGRSAGGRPPGPWSALLALPVVAMVIPASLVVSGPLRSNGWPARLLIFWIASMIVLGWIARWCGRREAPGERAGTPPVEVGAWLLILGLCTSLAAAAMRNLAEVEAAGMLRFALALIPLVIVTIGVSTLADSRHCDLLLAGILLGAGIGAAIAIVQFVVPFDWGQVLQIPPLQTDDPSGTGSRGGFARIRGATAHPIELGVICGAAVPLGLHFVRFAPTQRLRAVAAVLMTLLVLSIPMAVSRSGILVVMLALAVYAAVLDGRQRLTALVLAIAGMAIFRAAVPGLLGTVVSTFTGASSDDSITGRTEDYSVINQLWTQQPLLGYGLGTFRPETYFFLDNQYLMALVEGGLTLLATTILFFVLGVASARGASRRAGSPAEASRGQAVAASLVAIAASGLFFDLFSFAQITVVTFVLAGVAGGVWRHGVRHGVPLPSPAQRFAAARSGEHPATGSGTAAFVPQPAGEVTAAHGSPRTIGGQHCHPHEDRHLQRQGRTPAHDADQRGRARPG